MKIPGALLLAITISLISLSGCASSVAQPTPSAPSPAAPEIKGELNISAAASLTNVLKEINDLYINQHPNVTIIPNFAASGTLQKQIENGAPADVFISAAAAQMDALQTGDLLLPGSRKDLLTNKVVLIVPQKSDLSITSFADLALDKVKKVAMGDPKFVPAGTYGQQALDLLGITSAVQPKLVLGSDVRQVLNYVETGNVDAGIVYSTDAKTSTGVKIVAAAPDSINAKVMYPVAIIKSSKNPDAAADYIKFLSGEQAMAIFEKYGFSPAKPL